MMRMGWLLLSFLIVATGTSARAASDREVLLEGVKSIAAPGSPGPLCVFGEHAFAVVTGSVKEKRVEPVVAAAHWGEGRVVAFGHDGYFGAEALAKDDTGKLLLNAVRWSSGRAAPSDVRVATSDKGLAAFLQKSGLKVAHFDVNKLSECDVLCLHVNALAPEAARAAVTAFVKKGGGLLVGGLGWGWLQLNPGKTLADDNPGNRTLADAGIVWADGSLSRTNETGFDATIAPPELCNASKALQLLLDMKEKNLKPIGHEIAQATWSLTQAARSLPPDEPVLLPRLKQLEKELAGGAVPTPEKPLKTRTDALARLVLTLQLEEMKKLPLEKLSAHPAAAAFPGGVPADAPRVERTLSIETRIPRWHSTGLYAAPGELINITLPESAAGKSLRVRIGAHTDSIAHLDSWSRCPEISRQWPLTAIKTPAGNVFGGLIYIEIPANCKLGAIDVCIGNAIEAPRFVLGKTTLEAWRMQVRKHPAPWAELQTSKVILTVKSDYVRELDDPEALMKFWDQVMDACAELAGIPAERPSPERYVTDVQISAGYMHSGYPIMAPLSITKAMIDTQWMQTKDEPTWGFFHEMGHNHQVGAWTFEGTGEVTCNLFSRFVLEKVSGVPVAKQRIQGAEAMQALRQHLAGGAKFDEWKAKPFLALIMYDQLQKAFGWETYKKVLAGYNDPANGAQPANDGEKRDQWMVRFSRACGKNLGPFFQAWGVPTSEKARAAIAELPAWMPEDFPAK